MSMIIDRRLNDRNKNATNRQRFIRRYKAQLRRSVADLVAERSITDMSRGGEVGIPVKDISEPRFRIGKGGDREMVHPGNHSFSPGDLIAKPPAGGGGGSGDGGGGDGGGGQDNFMFTLSKEEFMNLFFDDLELPRLARNVLGDSNQFKYRRAGYTPSGVPANLSIRKSLENAMARRIALKSPLKRQLRELEEAGGSEEEIAELKARLERIPFLDEYDLRFRHRVKEPKPISRAVMFCLMDVSASMSEQKKDLAKRFYTLLHMFLSRKYEKVELVFIRHTSNAEEVDEHAFFHDPQTGGTVVMSALNMMVDILEERYDPASWNIYGAQVSDGDAFGSDPQRSAMRLSKDILPSCRYFAYVEIPDNISSITPLGAAYSQIRHESFAMSTVLHRGDVYPVLRELFQREAA
ncbi:YeaH/YhbH family protein [Spongiibacter taiwanensis]|uniref:YeaH/YhbH family protein n=1 Tax=Spongiibacter taiwanensis TaxID=1748242 RepID=UPI002035537C|nr:YeaH/YhbH family protein [Spongiibacter taiwanensis]USA42546.1 YeaH/YhbH family protein [Spongiibacter taiwanensis]